MQPELPPGRYDPPRRRRPAAVALVAVVVATAAFAATYALYSRYERGRLSAQLTGYDVVSDRLVRVSFEVVTGGKPGTCKVRVQDRTKAETGAALVPVTPSGTRSQVVTVDVATRSRAVTAELVGCRRR